MKAIDESLIKFLLDDSFKVAVLKGEWGIGKTYFWRNFFDTNREKFDFKAYSYVSLFGAKEVNDLKKQIFANFVMLDDKKILRHLEKLKPLSVILKAVDIPYLSSSKAISELVESKLIDNFLICFDDLERKESSISASSVLGLISNLKEEKHCKILLIYNDRELDENTEREINEYREKVVDLDLTYKPTIDDNLSIIWPDGCPQYVSEIFRALELNNIRIMQRVRWAQEYFGEFINSKYPHLSNAFQYKAAALTVLYHGYSNQISIEEAISTSYYTLLLSKDDEDKERFNALKTLNYLPEEQDKSIADYLVNGYVDFQSYEDLLRTKNEQYRLNNINEESRSIWSEYHSNFTTSQEEFVADQVRFLKENVEDLGVRDIAATIDFVCELDDSQDLDDLLDRSIDLFVSKAERLDRHELQTLQSQPELIKKIQDKFARKTLHYPMSQLFVELAGSDGWNPRDIQHLKRFSEDDYFEWITSEKNENVIPLLKEFLRRFGHQNDDEKAVVEKIQVALEKVKERSLLDRCRVEYLIEGKKEE